MRTLVAGFGNVLQRDDGFGVELLRRLERHPELPAETVLLEAGIGGISLVQELLAGYDALIVLDAAEGETAGEVKLLELTVADLADAPIDAVRDAFADVHYAEPGRALALAKALGALPERALLVGCVPVSTELGQGLSAPVAAALDDAEKTVFQLLARWRELRRPVAAESVVLAAGSSEDGRSVSERSEFAEAARSRARRQDGSSIVALQARSGLDGGGEPS